jgi:subtilisin
MVGKPFKGSTFGVAPDAKLAAAIVIEGGDVPARVVGGLDWCVGQGVRLVNISLGLSTFEPQFSIILRLLRQRNVLPIVAIGNEGAQTSRTPGNLPEALSVGAIDESDQIWFSSSSQQMAESPKRYVPVLIAPGAGIWSCVPGEKLTSLSGTSMTAPHVTALAALLLEHRQETSADDLEKAIVASCKRPAAISTLRGNNGVPDGVAALAALK